MNAEENTAKLCYLLWDYLFLLPPHPITHSLLHDNLLKIKPGFFSRNICFKTSYKIVHFKMVKMEEHLRSCSAACSQFDTNKLIKILKKKKRLKW